MKLGIASKFDMAGGSEFRAAELANGIVRYTDHDAYLLIEKRLPDQIAKYLDPKVNIVRNAITTPDIFYEMDNILIINTDSKCFTKPEYWAGESDRHSSKIDLTRIKGLTFLFNFIVSPAEHLWKLEEQCPNIRIITTNKRFFDELSFKDKHSGVRHFRRMILESPINPDTVYDSKFGKSIIRIGKHSHAVGNKWNKEHAVLIDRINEKYSDQVIWDFMGITKELEKELAPYQNVICRKTFSLPVSKYLEGIHIFLFFIDWKRQEPWARSTAEALMSGCPVLATDTDGGNRMQIVHGSNGYLCKTVDDFEKHLDYLIQNPEKIDQLGSNARFYSDGFKTETIVNKLVRFMLED